MQLLKQLLDKIFFTLGFIVFLQLPHFIDQYTQRIGGYTESKQQQLADYQTIADNNFNGELILLIEGFKNSSELAVRQTGEKISETKTDVQQLDTEIKTLEQEGLFDKIVFLSTHLRLDIATGTINSFKPGIPLSLWSLAYGLFGGILFSLLFNGITKIPKLFRRKRRATLQN